jgi:hypothetical protein
MPAWPRCAARRTPAAQRRKRLRTWRPGPGSNGSVAGGGARGGAGGGGARLGRVCGSADAPAAWECNSTPCGSAPGLGCLGDALLPQWPPRIMRKRCATGAAPSTPACSGIHSMPSHWNAASMLVHTALVLSAPVT